MRIKDSASFPHPVLSSQTKDYGGLSLTVEIEVEENPISGKFFLNGKMQVADAEVLELVRRGDARAGVMVTCRDTYYDDLHVTGLDQFRLDLSGGRLRGRTNIRAVIVAVSDGIRLASEYIDSEYPDESRMVSVGDIIAASEEFAYEVGLEKLAPLESIFRLKLLHEIPEGEFQISLEGESIDILANSELHGLLSIMRDNRAKDVLLSSLYLPTLMNVLEAMKIDDQYEGRRWHTVMAARCRAEGVDLKTCDLAQVAQRMLDRPLRLLGKVLEGVSA